MPPNRNELSDIESAISELEHLNELVDRENSRTNNSTYDDCRQRRVVIKRAKEALERLRNAP